ncbi:MAG: GGDEF domain-containing protein [Pseudolabrys sp.]
MSAAPDQPEAPRAALLLAEIERLKQELTQTRARIADLEARADVDPLLDMLNRRGFERELKRSLAYVQRYGTEAALIYLDLDGFKSINDRYGHGAGDNLLKAVASRLISKVRGSDVVARLGGDEFAVLIWNASADHALAKAQDLEATVADTAVIHGAARLSVGASAGIAGLGALDTPAQVIESADKAMYARKRARNSNPLPQGEGGEH